jgi:hypothetical protein
MKAVIRLLALLVIVGLFSIPAAVATAAPATPAPAAVATTAPATAATAVEIQPHMREALEALRAAKRHLEEAEPDKGGHRVAAIKAVDNAIRHTEQGIGYANRH